MKTLSGLSIRSALIVTGLVVSNMAFAAPVLDAAIGVCEAQYSFYDLNRGENYVSYLPYTNSEEVKSQGEPQEVRVTIFDNSDSAVIISGHLDTQDLMFKGISAYSEEASVDGEPIKNQLKIDRAYVSRDGGVSYQVAEFTSHSTTVIAKCHVSSVSR